jgi:hypothetical protein
MSLFSFVFWRCNVILLIGLYACTSNTAINKKLKGCDSLVITFNAPDTDSVIKEVTATETRAIQKLARFLKGKETERYNCGYDGNMLFFKGGRQVLPVVFKFRDKGCQAFIYDLDNKTVSTTMGNEAVDFLTSLAEGKSWY